MRTPAQAHMRCALHLGVRASTSSPVVAEDDGDVVGGVGTLHAEPRDVCYAVPVSE